MKIGTFGMSVCLAVFLATEVRAQQEGGRRGFGSPDAFFDRLDQNGDGTIDPDEVPQRMRGFLERTGVDLSRGLTRDAFTEAMGRAREQFSRRGGERGPREGRGPGDANRRSGRAMVTPDGVGEARPANRQRGGPSGGRGFFGRSGREGSAEDSARGDRRRGRDGNEGNIESVRERSQQFTQRMLDRYDRNNDGVLASDEVPEWLSRGAAELDSNQDGILNPEEITNRFQQRWRRRSGNPAGDSTQDETASSAPQPPVGLPAWFQETDQNRDLQIGFYEWDHSRTGEFLEMDANQDGFLTPEEVLAANRPRTEDRRNPRRSGSSEGRSRGRFGQRR